MAPSANDEMIAAWLDLQEILDRLPDEPPASNCAAVRRMNEGLTAHRRFWVALRAAGLGIVADALEDHLRGELERSMRRSPDQIPIGERRAIVAAALHKAGFHLPNAGPKDLPMQRAMLAANLFIETTEEVGRDGTPEEWEAAFRRRYAAMALSGRDDFEAVKRSITRFKASVENKPMVKFDPVAFAFKLVPFDEAAHGLKREPGRPRKRR